MLYNIRDMKWETDQEEIMRKVQAPLEHRFNNHCYCSNSWCQFLQASKDGKTYSPPAGSFYCKVADKALYDELKPVFDRFTSVEVVMESIHNMSTQINESMNNVITQLCPKLKHVSESITLLTRVCLAVAYSNIGFTSLYNKILDKLGVDSSSLNDPSTRILVKTLQRIDNMKVNESKRKKNKSTEHVISTETKQKGKNRSTSNKYLIEDMGLTKQVLPCPINPMHLLLHPC